MILNGYLLQSEDKFILIYVMTDEKFMNFFFFFWKVYYIYFLCQYYEIALYVVESFKHPTDVMENFYSDNPAVSFQ